MEQNYTEVLTNSQMREAARTQLKNNWLMSILICVIFGILISMITSLPIIGWILMGPLTVGLNKYFLNLKRSHEAYIENLFDGFKVFASSAIAQIVIYIITMLLSLLLIIPGIIAGLAYSQTLYILIDHPELKALEAMKRSSQIMNGYKGKLFMMQLSFVGWALLCVLTLGIGFFWLYPYIHASLANFYDSVKDNPVY